MVGYVLARVRNCSYLSGKEERWKEGGEGERVVRAGEKSMSRPVVAGERAMHHGIA